MFTVFGYGQIEHKPISEGQDWTVQAIDMSKFLVPPLVFSSNFS
jgi:hypothetical protein